MDIKKYIEIYKKDFNNKWDWMLSEFNKIRTGRVNISIFDTVKVESYGSLVPLNQVANIQIVDAKQVLIKPYDPSTIQDVAAGINKANLGVNPVVDSKDVRLSFPSPTEEVRKTLVKKAKDVLENAKIQLRNARQDVLKLIKNDKEINKEDHKYYEEQINKETKDMNSKLESEFANKEKDVMTI